MGDGAAELQLLDQHNNTNRKSLPCTLRAIVAPGKLDLWREPLSTKRTAAEAAKRPTPVAPERTFG